MSIEFKAYPFDFIKRASPALDQDAVEHHTVAIVGGGVALGAPLAGETHDVVRHRLQRAQQLGLRGRCACLRLLSDHFRRAMRLGVPFHRLKHGDPS